jgi:hypothetical protein
MEAQVGIFSIDRRLFTPSDGSAITERCSEVSSSFQPPKLIFVTAATANISAAFTGATEWFLTTNHWNITAVWTFSFATTSAAIFFDCPRFTVRRLVSFTIRGTTSIPSRRQGFTRGPANANSTAAKHWCTKIAFRECNAAITAPVATAFEYIEYVPWLLVRPCCIF